MGVHRIVVKIVNNHDIMREFMNYIFLVIGFFLLIKGADWFVSGASGIARLLRIPSVMIGLTVVAMGTSAPELSVSIAGDVYKRQVFIFLWISHISNERIFAEERHEFVFGSI